jgi:hypothetical protein
VVEASAVFLQGNALCSPKADAVRGKVVVGIMSGASLCNYMSMYRRIDAAGAVGFVKLVLRSPPGWSAFDHDAWDSSETREMSTTMVHVFSGDLGIGPEEGAITADLRVRISPPHNTDWEEAYTSIAWLIVMRIGTPLIGIIFVAWPGFLQTRFLWRSLVRDDNLALGQMRAASFVVCFTASLCSCIICLMLVLGQWAAQITPSFINEYLYTSFTGTSTLTTAISCAALVEKHRGTAPRNLPLRVLTKQYPFTLVLVTLFGPGFDFFIGFFRTSGLENFSGYYGIHVPLGIALSLFQGSLSLVFLFYANAIGKLLLEYQKSRSSFGTEYLTVIQQLSAVVMALVMNSIFLILNVVFVCFYAILIQSHDTPVIIIRVYTGLLPALRIGSFYWQVLSFICAYFCPFNISCCALQIQLMKPRQRRSMTFELCAAIYECLCTQKRHSTVFPANHVSSVPYEETPDNNMSSSYWDASTITSISSVGVYDYSLRLPFLPTASSSGALLQPHTHPDSKSALQIHETGGSNGHFVENDNSLVTEQL